MSAAPAPVTLRRVRAAILTWYDSERRDFPWRGLDDPYAILVSEVMLQQTQAARVTLRFPRFVVRFPTAAALGSAPTAEVLAEWNGLGYNRRALALQRAAAAVAKEGWPRDIAGLAALPGVGPYTARAVASLAFRVPVGVVDTNVRRWLVRRFGTVDRPSALQHLADELAAPGEGDEAAAWTHASMEFGAAVCRSRAPRCEACPVRRGCASRGSAPTVAVPRQAAMRGSDRAYRGAVLRHLSAAAGHALSEDELRGRLVATADTTGPAPDPAAWRRLMAGLERDGLLHRAGDSVRLGAATIGR